MNSLALFSDVSLDPKRKLGVGGYLVVPTSFIETSPEIIKGSEIAERLVVQNFEGTSCTRLEVQTVLWAIEACSEILKDSRPGKLDVYSDSQCVAGLLRRRPGLEANGFLSKRTNNLLKNASLYRKFYEFHDRIGFKVIKVAGHTRSCSHDTVHRIFSFVDKEVRKALNSWMRDLEAKNIKPRNN